MFEGPVRTKSKLTDPSNDVSFTLAKGRNWSRSACHLAPSLGVTPFEFMEKLYGSWHHSLPGNRQWKIGEPSLHHFGLIHPCDKQINGQTELRWLRCSIAVPAVVRKNTDTNQEQDIRGKNDQCQAIQRILTTARQH